MIECGLKDKVVIITGANNPWGIGATTALSLCQGKYSDDKRVYQSPHRLRQNYQSFYRCIASFCRTDYEKRKGSKVLNVIDNI